MRVIAIVAAALLVGLSPPAMAQCMGKGPNEICVVDDGVWTQAGFIRYSDNRSGIGKYPNVTSAGPNSAPATGAAASGETGVLKPSAESGNAWVLTPQTGGESATCGQGIRCD